MGHSDLVVTIWNTELFPHKENEIVDTWLKKIVGCYSEPQRFYHNLTHISHLLYLFDSFRSSINNPVVMLLAIYFHDIVYDPLSTDNESRSVLLFHEFFEQVAEMYSNFNSFVKRNVSSFIQATTTHSLIELETNELAEDLKLFLDFDLEVLSWPISDYLNYAENIRKEYSHLSAEEFCLGRKAVLVNFQKRKQIFFNDKFRTREDLARKNLDFEITELSHGL